MKNPAISECDAIRRWLRLACLGAALFFTAGAPRVLAAEVISIDTAKSSIKWTGKKLAGAHYGTLRLSKGQVQVKDGILVGGSFEIDMNSLAVVDIKEPSLNAKLVGHLKSDDFFSVGSFPLVTFTITKAELLPDAAAGAPNYQITGDLSIKGIVHSISFPALAHMSGGVAHAAASTSVDRTKWNVRYGSGKFFANLGDKLIKDDFDVELHIVGYLRKAG